MAIFASTTTSGYSDPMKAMTIKALEKRQADMLAQQAQQQPDAAMMATIPGGIGHVLGVVGDRMAQSRTDQAMAARRQELAQAMAGIDINNPDPKTMATIASADPELYKTMLSTWAENRRAAEQNRVTSEGQDKTLLGTREGHGVTREGQQLSATTTREGHGVTREGQTLVDARARELAAAEDARARELAAQGDTRARELAAQEDARARELQKERLAAEAALEEKKLAAAQATAAADPKKAEAVATLEKELVQKDLMVNELSRAEEALTKGINTGISGQIATGISKLPGGGYIADKEQGQRTELFDNTMNKVATGAMSSILKGQSTDFEMKKFIAMYNNPNIAIEAKRAAFSDVLAAAKKDREIEARAVKKVGGDTSVVAPAGPAATADPLEGKTATGPDGSKINPQGREVGAEWLTIFPRLQTRRACATDAPAQASSSTSRRFPASRKFVVNAFSDCWRAASPATRSGSRVR